MWTPKGAVEAVSDRFIRWLDRIAEDGIRRLVWWRMRSWFGHLMVSRKLVAGERVIAEVCHSGILYILPTLVGVVGVVLAVAWLPFVPSNVAPVGLAAILGMLGWALYKSLSISRDRFVVTDSRVFRVWGVLSVNEAEMEIVRLLDVTVIRPWYLRPFHSGHMVLENAAQQQGLREIHYIPRPEELARIIHRRRRDMSGAGPKPPAPPKPNSRRPDHPRRPGPVTARRR